MGLKQMTSSPQCWQSAAHFPADQHTELDEVPICLRSLQGYDWLLPALLIYLQMRIRANSQNKGSDVIRFNLNYMYGPFYTMKGKIYVVTAASVHICLCLSVCHHLFLWLTASILLDHCVEHLTLLCSYSYPEHMSPPYIIYLFTLFV